MEFAFPDYSLLKEFWEKSSTLPERGNCVLYEESRKSWSTKFRVRFADTLWKNHSIYMTQTGVTILKNLYLNFSDYRRKLSYLIQFEGLNFWYSSSFWLSPVDSGFLWSRKFNGYLIHWYKMILVIQGLLRIWQFNSHFIVGLKTVTLVGHHHHPKWWRHNDDYVTPNSKCG